MAQSSTAPASHSLSIAGTSLDPLFVWKKGHSVGEALDFVTSTAATLARLGSGAYVAHVDRSKHPAKVFELYDREGDPSCRKVREALSILDLNAIVHPCPDGGRRFRDRVEAHIGRFAVPLFVDPNVGVELTDADAIVEHLFTRYGDGKVPLPLRAGRLSTSTSRVASWLRGSKGQSALESKTPDQLLELFSYEASPYSRVVREVLCQLELPYMLHNVARGSIKRADFLARSGRMQFPYLIDESHGVAMFESNDIVRYLEGRYGR